MGERYNFYQMRIILDNGHGKDTPGKRSPIYNFGQLQEWSYTREIVRKVSAYFPGSLILVPEDTDVCFNNRVARVNSIEGKKLLISIHINAGGGSGVEVFTSRGETKSDQVASIFYSEAVKKGFKVRTDYADGDPDKEENFFILRYSTCPAVLTESFFMDNEKECHYLLSDKGKNDVVKWHVNSINECLRSLVF